MLEHLINSKARLAILSFLFKNPNQKYYVREIVKNLGLDPANIHKELNNLEKGGFLLSEQQDNKKYFFVNQNNTFFNGLKEILSQQDLSIDKLEWFCLEEMPNYYPMMVVTAWNVHYANEFFKYLNLQKRFSTLANSYNNNFCKLLVPKQEFNEISQEVIAKLKEDNNWGERYVRELEKREKKLYQISDKLKKMNFKNLSDQELFGVFDNYYQIYKKLHIFHWVQTVSDFGDNLFSKYLMGYLKEKIKDTPYSLGDIFSVLTTPTKLGKAAEEYENLLSISKYILNKPKIKKYFNTTETRIINENLIKLDPQLEELLKDHTDKFGWLGYGTAGPGWDKSYFIDILSSLIRQQANPEKLLQEIKKNRQENQKKQIELIKILQIDPIHEKILQFARDLVFTKGSRKDSMFYTYSVVENLYREIGRRHYLSVRQVRYLCPCEFKKLLIDKNFHTAILNERYRFSVYYSQGDYSQDTFLTGAKAQEFFNQLNIIKDNTENVKVISGDCASPGRTRGIVKIINEVKDMVKMEPGDILVSVATNPELMSAIKKAAAIVTDIGGITCHAAIISRELGIPCVVGTKIATKVLKDGDTIDVSATHGKVDIIQKN